MSDENSTVVVLESLASKGTISCSSVIAVLTQGVAEWIPIIPGTFQLCEINFTEPSLPRPAGGVVGFKFKVQKDENTVEVIYISLAVMAAVKVEEIPGG